MIEIYGIVYGDKETEYKPYVNKCTQNAHRFENNAMIDIIDNRIWHLTDADLLGIFSWKFQKKTGITRQRIMEAIRQPGDVYNCSPYLGDHIHFMDWSEAGHPGIKYFIEQCCKITGMRYNNDCQHVFWANQFIATKKVYVNYINNILKPSLQLLEGELWPMVNVPAGYTAGMKLPKLKELTGLDFYNYVPFVLERMFMQYVDNYKLKVINV